MSVFARLHGRFHEARADLFVRLLDPAPGSRLLDLGGSDGALAERLTRRVPLEVTIADVHARHADAVRGRGFEHVVLDGDGRLPFDDEAFDIVFCNSVIEHVTLPKERCRTDQRVDEEEWRREARAAQRAFAGEVRRVGRRWFVQTPHRHFPIDAHTWLPFTQYLSHNAACRLVGWTDRFWVKKCWGVADWELLTPRDMAGLFPDGALHVERAIGLPKSVVAYGPRP